MNKDQDSKFEWQEFSTTLDGEQWHFPYYSTALNTKHGRHNKTSYIFPFFFALWCSLSKKFIISCIIKDFDVACLSLICSKCKQEAHNLNYHPLKANHCYQDNLNLMQHQPLTFRRQLTINELIIGQRHNGLFWVHQANQVDHHLVTVPVIFLFVTVIRVG